MGWLSKDMLRESDDLRQSATASAVIRQTQQARMEAEATPPPPTAPSVDFGGLVKSLTATWDDGTSGGNQTPSSGGSGFDIGSHISSLAATWADPSERRAATTSPAGGISNTRQQSGGLTAAWISPQVSVQNGSATRGGGGYSASGGSNPEKQAEVYRQARASGLDDEGARILVAVTETEGGLEGAIGDDGQSRGAFQFFEGGQMPGFRAWVRQQGIQGDPDTLVHDVRLATRYAAEGYLGRAIAAGRAQGLSGADLATYVQRHGQVSVSPERTGQNYQRLYGGASPNAGAPPSAPATSPAAAAPAPSPAAGASRSQQQEEMVTVRMPEGDTMQVPRSMVGEGPGKYAPSKGWQIVGESPQYKTGPEDMPLDDGQSAGDQKRQKLAEAAGVPYDNVPADASASTFPLPARKNEAEYDRRQNEAAIYRQPVEDPDALWSPDEPAAPVSQYGAGRMNGGGVYSRLPIATDPEASTGDRYDPDSGPRESGYTVPADPSTYGGAGDDQGSAAYAAPGSFANDPVVSETPVPSPADDPGGAQWAAQDAYSTPAPAPARYNPYGPSDDPTADAIRATTPDAAPAPTSPTSTMLPVWDDQGEVVGYRQAPAPAQRQVQQRQADGYGAVTSTPGEPDYVPQPPNRLQQVGEFLGTAGGLPEMGSRIREINDKAARDQGRFGDVKAMFTAADDLAWRAANPKIAAEYDDLQYQYMMGIAGQVGDSGVPRMAGRAASEAVQGGGKGAARAVREGGDDGARELGSGFVGSPGYTPPTPQQIKRAEMQGARRGEMLNREVKLPPSSVPGRVRVVTAATDDRAGLRYAEDMLTDAAGSPRLRENDPARPSTQSRVNAGSIADTRITNELEPAIIKAGDAGLQAELPQYIEDMHAKDILDEFYTRGKQKVLDDRAEKIAAAQANGASPQVIQRMQAKADADAEAAGVAAIRKRQGNNPEHSYEAIEARLQAQEARLTAAGTKPDLDEAAQAIWDHNAQTRQRLVDAGEMSQEAADYYAQAYPHYVPTVPISHLDARGGGGPVASAAGPRVSRGTQPSVKALEDVGTSGERLNPIVASRNATVRAERNIQRNNVARAFAQMMDDAMQASPGTLATDPATHRTFLGGGTDVHYFENGERLTLSVPKPVADGLEAAANMGADPNGAGRLWRAAMGAVTASMTAGRASFLPVNLMRDVQDYALRTAKAEGGPHKLPGVMGTWFDEAGKAVADIARAQVTGRGMIGAATGFAGGAVQGDEDTTLADRLRHGAEGAVAGTFLLGANKVKPSGKAAEYIARGGGAGGLSAHWGAGQRWYRDVMRDGGAPIRSAQDAARYLGDWMQDIATLQGVKGINERTELISRTAAMRRADQQGLAPVEAMTRGRDASYDPDRAGTVARMLNGWVPFFNASVQNAAQTGRYFKQNWPAATATLLATTAPVVLGVEAWNRSDPERARVYDDVPQYIKDSGIVAVLPWAGSDNRGERPNYLWVPTGMATPFVATMREVMKDVPGLEPSAGRTGSSPDAGAVERWADVLGTVVGMFSPIRGDSAAAMASNLIPQGVKQVAELGLNRDFYRGNPIMTDNSDERASAFSRTVAEGANAAGRMIGNDALQEVRPSGVEHVVRALPAYGDIVTGASDMVAPSGYKQAEDRPIQNEPFVGGIAGRFIRDQGGANLQRAQDDKLPESVRTIFEEAGMRPSDMGTVPSSYKDAPLTRAEQERWQNATNQTMAQLVNQARRDPKWRDPSTREQAVRTAMSQAREMAAQRVLRNLSDNEIQRRKRADQSMKAS